MRETIQQKLEELTNIEVSAEIPDDMLEELKTYFSFTFTNPYLNSDFDNNYTYEVNVTGFVKRLIRSDENTLQIVDKATDDIISKLKELNIRCSSQDVSIENNVQKIKITGLGRFNEINNKLV